MTDPVLQTVERSPSSSPVGSVIWLHGLGADGHDFEPIAGELQVDHAPLRFVFPHAPVRPVTINGGIAMRAWFDVVGLERGSPQDESGIREAERLVRALIRRENERGVPTRQIVLGGFSQGGALALHTGLRLSERLAGLVGLSTFLPLEWTVDGEALGANTTVPVFLAHGTLDPLVSVTLGETTRDFLHQRAYRVGWKTYPIPHAVCPEEIADLRAWIAEAYAARDPDRPC